MGSINSMELSALLPAVTLTNETARKTFNQVATSDSRTIGVDIHNQTNKFRNCPVNAQIYVRAMVTSYIYTDISRCRRDISPHRRNKRDVTLRSDTMSPPWKTNASVFAARGGWKMGDGGFPNRRLYAVHPCFRAIRCSISPILLPSRMHRLLSAALLPGVERRRKFRSRQQRSRSSPHASYHASRIEGRPWDRCLRCGSSVIARERWRRPCCRIGTRYPEIPGPHRDFYAIQVALVRPHLPFLLVSERTRVPAIDTAGFYACHLIAVHFRPC